MASQAEVRGEGWGHFFDCQYRVKAGSNDTSDLQRVTGQLSDRKQNDQPQRMTFGRRILHLSQGGRKKA